MKADLTERNFLRQAYDVARSSTDRSIQNGAIIVNGSGRTVASGSNHFPTGVAELPERLVRPEKYLYVVHAETAAIYEAAKKGESTDGGTMYSPWAACGECAKAIIQAGIKRVVVHKEAYAKSERQWVESIGLALNLFQEAGVEYVLLSAQYKDGLSLLFNGALWEP